jgi:hypothetical protein
MSNTFKLGRMTKDSAEELYELTRTAPIECYKAPFAFLEDPASPGVQTADAPAVESYQVVTGRAVFHADAHRTEFCIICQPVIQTVDPFKPYFILVADPARSSRAMKYLVGIVNVLVARKAVFQFEPVYVDLLSNYASLYNPLTQESSSGGF